jgi:protein-tyrosine phosphatase
MRTEKYTIKGPWPGELAIVPRPRGEDWLEEEIERLNKDGFDAIVSLLTSSEGKSMGLLKEEAQAKQAQLEFHSFPIQDRDVPSSRREFHEFIKRLDQLLSEGKKVGVHCRQGIGRSSMIAAALLIAHGVSAEDAFQKIEKARGVPVPETAEQRQWISNFARELSHR